jgi:hypothetical protein
MFYLDPEGTAEAMIEDEKGLLKKEKYNKVFLSKSNLQINQTILEPYDYTSLLLKVTFYNSKNVQRGQE